MPGTLWVWAIAASLFAEPAAAVDPPREPAPKLAVNLDESRNDVRQYLRDSPRTCRIVLESDTNLAGSQTGSGGEGALRTLLGAVGLEAR
jgi:hypothetical protein